MLFENIDAVREKAATLFEKTPSSINQDTQIIKQWLETQPHLPELMDDIKIANFLLLNKYSIEKTKQKIDLYYTIRSLLPDIFDNVNPKSSQMRHFMDVTYCCMHPKTLDGLYRIYFFKVKNVNNLMPKEFGLQCGNIAEVRLYEDCMVGDVIIFDMSTLSLNDLTKVNPVLLSKILKIYEVFSMRVKRIYIINSPSYVGKLLQIVKMVVKPKIFSRIQVHDDDNILKEIFTQDELPKDYGGDGPSLDYLNEMITTKFDEYQNRFDLLDAMKVDESTRPDKTTNDEILGFHGNFKQLNVD